MSTNEPSKPTKREPWEVVEDLLAQAEADRIDELTPEQLDAELRAAGIDPTQIPTPEEMLAGAQKRAEERAAAAAQQADRTEKSRRWKVMERILDAEPPSSERRPTKKEPG